MRFKRDDALKKSKRPAGSIVLYVAAIVVTIIGVAFLVTNIVLFQKSLAQYVAQGYAAADVASQLIPSQLLPGIYEPIGVYGGIALILFGAGVINQKISKSLKMLEDLRVEGAELDADEIDIEASDVDGLEPNGLKSGELGSSEFETGKIGTDEVQAVEI
ncbi:hypothetical protein [Desulfosporosinus sp. Sb-LF]|uniref:hypothetical protein n=1 Tax=Desulfosporosinus sp. Sb-LF TaxID=2560027 RepID=UPI0018EEADCA|nr:hypothetical protein [Desulfosporosinus sp. Sb-LF]